MSDLTLITQFIYPADREGTLLLSPDQITAADDILRVTVDGKIYDRVIEGGIRAEHIRCYANGSDQTTNLNTAFGKAIVKQLIFDEPGTNVYVVNGTVTIPNNVIITIKGKNSFGGTGTINGGTWDVADNQQIWASTVTANPYSFVTGYIPPAAWGFFPGTTNDMTPALQKAINYGINSAINKKVLVTILGTYYVQNLVIASYSGGNAQQCTVSIEATTNSTNQAVTFFNNNVNAATIHIQVGQGIDIVNIIFQGIGPDVANFVTAEDAQWTAAVGGGTIRSSRKSPGQCGISIDNFYAIGATNSTITSSADYYPGMSSYYTNTTYSGSTNINIINCSFSRLYVGVAEGISGAPNGEGIRIQGGYGVYVAYLWAAGQLQSRENTINNFYFIFGHTFITNYGWGTGIGDMPSVNNSNINYLKYMFTCLGNFTIPRFTTGYSEGIWSLGYHGGQTPIIFDKWNLTLAPNNYIGGSLNGMAPLLLQTSGTFTFSNGNFQAGNYFSGLPFRAQAVYFENSRLECGYPFNANFTTFYDNIKFINVFFFQNGGNIRLDENRNETSFDAGIYTNANQSYLLPGGKIKDATFRTFENVGKKFDLIHANTDNDNTGYAVTVNSTTQTLTFTATNGGIFLMGDVIVTPNSVDYTNDIFDAAPTTLGYVSNVSGNVITLSNIPFGVVNSGNYQMYILRIPRWIGHTLGTLTSGNNTITSVISDGAFIAGDRIKGIGIIEGTYVISNSGTSIVMSTNATANGSLIQLSDASIKITANDTTFYYAGGNYNYDLLPLIWFVGDELKNLTTGIQSLGRYCVQAGKATTGNLPTWFTVNKTPSSTANTTIASGGLGLQGLGIGNDLILSNLYFDGANFRYIGTGVANVLQFFNGGIIIYTAPSGTGGTVATVTQKFAIDINGIVSVANTPNYASNALAISGGLIATNFYRNGDNVCVVH